MVAVAAGEHSERSCDASPAPEPPSSPRENDCGGATTTTSSVDGGDNITTTSTSSPSSDLCVINAALRFQVTLYKDAFGLGIYFSEGADGRAVVDPELPFYRLPDDGEAPGERSRAIAPGDVLCAIDGRALEALAFAAVVDELRCLTTGAVTLTFERALPVDMAALTLQTGMVSAQAQVYDHETWSRRDRGKSEEAKRPAVSDTHIRSQSEHKQEGSEVKSVKQQRWNVFQRLSAVTTGGNSAANAAHLSNVEALEEMMAEMEAKLQAAEGALEREKKCRFLAEKKNILYRNELLRLSGENSALRYDLSRHKSASSQRAEFCLGNLHLAI